MIQELGYFIFVTILDLFIDYYHLPLDKETSNLCSIYLPFRIYKYKRLPQGVMLAVDCF